MCLKKSALKTAYFLITAHIVCDQLLAGQNFYYFCTSTNELVSPSVLTNFRCTEKSEMVLLVKVSVFSLYVPGSLLHGLLLLSLRQIHVVFAGRSRLVTAASSPYYPDASDFLEPQQLRRDVTSMVPFLYTSTRAGIESHFFGVVNIRSRPKRIGASFTCQSKPGTHYQHTCYPTAIPPRPVSGT